MRETEFQAAFLSYLQSNFPDNALFAGLELDFDQTTVSRRRDDVMPNVTLDVVTIDSENLFHMWELKLINSPELKTGKFFGQMILYDYLFNSSDKSYLEKQLLKSVVSAEASLRIPPALENNSEDTQLTFSSWNLCVCGGQVGALDAGNNPIIWTYWVAADLYFKHEAASKIQIWHFFTDDKQKFCLENLMD